MEWQNWHGGRIIKKEDGRMVMESIVGTIVVGCILLAAVGLIVAKIIADRKKGKGHCGGDCGSCRKCH